MKSDSSLAALSTQWSNMNQIITELENHKAKKPWLAGLMSAVVPGSGKFYAGKKGEGVASFIGTVSFGLVAWENYRKLGIKHPKTIIFGSIFAATYVSNIYGSVVSVRIYETEYNHAIHNQILFQLHIPLRNYFD
jgi:TM2 domain-containing membrane protein YozV